MWMANPHTFCNNDAIAPRPLAFNLWTPQHLITTTTTTTTTMADYCLRSYFLQLTRLIVECKWQQQFDLIIGPHKRRSHFRLFVWFGFSIFCLFVHKLYAPSLLHFWWISSATYRPGMWTTAFWVVFSGSVLTQISKRCRGRWRKKRLFWYVLTRP